MFKQGLNAGGVAVVANLVLFGAGRVAGVPFAVEQGGDTVTVTAGHVAAATIVAVLAGTVVALLARRRSPGALRAVETAAVVVAAATHGGPQSGGVDQPTKLLLAAMHLVTLAAFLVGPRLGSVPARLRPAL
jgi:hypothetical protein